MGTEGGGQIANFETGNPPEGWESEGQLRMADLKKAEGRLRIADLKKQNGGCGETARSMEQRAWSMGKDSRHPPSPRLRRGKEDRGRRSEVRDQRTGDRRQRTE